MLHFLEANKENVWKFCDSVTIAHEESGQKLYENESKIEVFPKTSTKLKIYQLLNGISVQQARLNFREKTESIQMLI